MLSIRYYYVFINQCSSATVAIAKLNCDIVLI